MVFSSFTALTTQAQPQLALVATYDTGLGGLGSEIISIRETDGIAALTIVAGSVDVLNLSDPLIPQLLRRVVIDTTFGTPNSVAVHPQHNFFLVVTGTPGITGAVAAYRISDGAFLTSAPVGIQPDSIAISPNGQYAVVANEAEGFAVGDNGGNGSLSVLDLVGFNAVTPGLLLVTNVALPSAAGQPGFSLLRTGDASRLPVDNQPATLEPETVAFTANSRYAYVSLKENSGVVRINLNNLKRTYFGRHRFAN